MSELHTSICRFCHAHCGILVELEDGRATRVWGDKRNPVYRGFSCAKGRSLPEQHVHPARLLQSQKRMPDGTHRPIPVSQAMDEIAGKLGAIVARHGPRSVALYLGTYSFPYPASSPVATSFMRALGSRMVFTSASIDQPGKAIALAVHGRWSAGAYWFDDCDAWMLVGSNPLVSMGNGIPNANPALRLHQARKRGLDLIVIDPRRSECAQAARVHLQPKPGEDPSLLAGMIRVVLSEGLADAEFLRAHASGVEALAAAVEPFTPDYVERRAGVPADSLREAARLFARAQRAGASAGTGPNMAPRGKLTEYLLLALQTLCGHWVRAGEPFRNPFALLPAYEPRAQAIAPGAGWGYGEKLRVRGLADSAGGLSAAALADEILLEGDGQVRALFNLGGNPLTAWPDQLKTLRAFQSLELGVTLDPRLSATAKLCDYVIAPKLQFEVPGTSQPNESLWFYGVGLGYPAPYAQYAPRLVEPPAGSDVIEEWEFFYGLAQRLGLQLSLHVANLWGPRTSRAHVVKLDMEKPPSTEELLAHLTHGSRIPLAEVQRHPHGAVFPVEGAAVLPAEPDCTARLDVGHPTILGELEQVAGEALERDSGFRFRLISRRLPNVYNSTGRDTPRLTRKGSHNPAFMHPDDLASLGLVSGEIVEIRSDHAAILGVVEAAPDVRRGVISMAHSFGDAPQHDARVREIGGNTGRLVSVDRDFDPHSGMPRMSAIPVNVQRVPASCGARPT
jgi:anaerobic selenocysteine-containing dehydrogenase